VKALAAQTRTEVVLTLRRGESVLLFFSLVDVLPHPPGDAVAFLGPGVLALAIMSTSMVSLGIATGFERQYGVLKRLGTTPLGRPALLAAKTISIVAIEAVQAIVLSIAAVALGWSPHVSVSVVAAVVLGSVAFAGLGLLMAGALRAEVTLAAANGLYLVLLLLGGMIIPLDKLPDWLHHLADYLPAGALAQAVDGTTTLHATVPGRAWAVLAVWAIAAPAAAATTFRWE
jgi:ABC-2 type transport system permease protein